MTYDLLPLVLAAFLQLVHVGLYSRRMTEENGVAYNLSPRDHEPKLSQRAARLRRAANNHAEALVLFAIALFAVVLLGKTSVISQTAAWIYLIARCLYVPAYAYGWAPWRSVFYGVATLATVTLLVLALL